MLGTLEREVPRVLPKRFYVFDIAAALLNHLDGLIYGNYVVSFFLSTARLRRMRMRVRG